MKEERFCGSAQDRIYFCTSIVCLEMIGADR